MILTITLNPSVDINYQTTEKFKLDQVNRVHDVSKTAGGKGLNVSRVLTQLNEEVAATGFLGGALGVFIQEEIKKIGIHDYFIRIQDVTRNCIAILHEGKQTELLESGPTVTASELELLLQNMSESIQKVNFITVSGSLPEGVPATFYPRIISIASQHSVPVLLDTKGKLLKHCLQHEDKPFLIKPNQDEIADLMGVKMLNEAEMENALQSDLFKGVPWAVVTLGENGAIIKHDHRIYRAKIPKVEVRNPVGSGDAVIAGFSSGLSKGLTGIPLIKYGLTMGILNAMEEKTGQINPTKIAAIQSEIEVT